MVMNANDEVDYVHEDDLIPHLEATNEKIKTEERLTAELQATGDKTAKPTSRETFPVDRRLNINTASARQIAETDLPQAPSILWRVSQTRLRSSQRVDT